MTPSPDRREAQATELLRVISGAGPTVESKYETWDTCIRAMIAFADKELTTADW